ncbi:MAG TPA: hypothetical protein VHD32_08450 [Candidatus Didemnitutus sp.]|nr:hypothetical protein [Candidatus Didemnitutus sp.]
MPSGRPRLPPEGKKKLFNCKLDSESFDRLKMICFRRSVANGKKFSEGEFVRDAIWATELPSEPSAAQINQYQSAFAQRKASRETRSLAAESRRLKTENARLRAMLTK